MLYLLLCLLEPVALPQAPPIKGCDFSCQCKVAGACSCSGGKCVCAKCMCQTKEPPLLKWWSRHHNGYRYSVELPVTTPLSEVIETLDALIERMNPPQYVPQFSPRTFAPSRGAVCTT